MALILFRINDNTIRFPAPIREDNGQAETTIPAITVTLSDKDGNPVAGLTALSATYRAARNDYAVVFPGTDMSITAEPGYTIDAAATGAWTDKINFENVPVTVAERRG